MKVADRLTLKLVDLIGGLDITGMLKQFKKEQYLPAAELESLRQKRLEHLLSIATHSTKHYAKYAGLPLSAFQPIKKSTYNAAPDDFFSSAYKGKVLHKSTSGSTGTPFSYRASIKSQSALWAGLLHSWEVCGYQFGERVGFIAGTALIKKGIKHSIFYKLMKIDLYPAAIMTGDLIDQYLEKISQRNTRLIYGYAMAINMVADHMLAKNIKAPASIRGIVCTAEMLTEPVRKNIEKAFGVPVYNQYGCNEGGVAAFECEDRRMHLVSSRCIYETTPEGALLATDLFNEADLFIKYETGDIVEFAEGGLCACGRTFPVINRIVGRTADIIVDRKNQRIHCAYFNFLFKDDSRIKQFQVLFDERSIVINLKVDDSAANENYDRYMDSMRRNFDFETYDLSTNGSFYTGRNFKHTFIIDRRQYPKAS